MKPYLSTLKILLECSLVVGVGGVLASLFDATVLRVLTPQAGLGLLQVSVVALVVGAGSLFIPSNRRPRIVSAKRRLSRGR